LGKLTPANILPGISQLLIDLKSNGYRLALASASLNAPLILDKLDLSTDFDAIADPSQVAAGKPAPDIFLAAAAAINVPIEDCLGIEDSIAGIQAINAAHALSIGIGSAENLKNTDLLVPNTAALTYAKVASVWK
jgi:haloacid dehalogenase superfamily, subfamily IA, variant 3 with third motif having DD or ED